ncbi:MAG: HlyD family type I secretion periplasmic adaptor subunit [Magnetococcales bacterium]|nr:HlyD family type I secretion periplasmic adaptor subunit [Magnetococcales bacterium]
MVLTDALESPSRIRPMAEMGNVRESGAAPLARRTGLLILGSIAPVLIWSYLAHVKEVAHAPGQVLPSGSVHAIQHLEGGIVAEVKVRESQLVDKEDVLLRMDERQTLPERDQAEVRLAGLQARSWRLRAFAEGCETPTCDSPHPNDPLYAEQKAIYLDQMQTLQDNLAVLDAQIAQRQAERAQAEGDLAAALKQLEVTAHLVKIRKELVEEKAISRVIYLETMRAHLTAQGEIQRFKKQIENSQGALDEARKRREQRIADAQREARDELGVAANEMAQVKELLDRMDRRVTRLDVRSPVRGLVQDLRVRTPGTVVQPGDVLLRIVPVEDHLTIEVRIPPNDVGRIAAGQPVVVKLTSYDFSRFGSLSGDLLSVSPSTLMDDQNKPYYKGLVTLPVNHLGDRPGLYPILPGMQAQVDITLGEKTILHSVLNPVWRSMSESFKER